MLALRTASGLAARCGGLGVTDASQTCCVPCFCPDGKTLLPPGCCNPESPIFGMTAPGEPCSCPEPCICNSDGITELPACCCIPIGQPGSCADNDDFCANNCPDPPLNCCDVVGRVFDLQVGDTLSFTAQGSLMLNCACPEGGGQTSMGQCVTAPLMRAVPATMPCQPAMDTGLVGQSCTAQGIPAVIECPQGTRPCGLAQGFFAYVRLFANGNVQFRLGIGATFQIFQFFGECMGMAQWIHTVGPLGDGSTRTFQMTGAWSLTPCRQCVGFAGAARKVKRVFTRSPAITVVGDEVMMPGEVTPEVAEAIRSGSPIPRDPGCATCGQGPLTGGALL